MSCPFLASIDVSTFAGEPHGLSLKELSYLKNVHINASSNNIEAVRNFIQNNIGDLEPRVNVTDVDSIDDIVSLLDVGATAAFVTPLQFEQLKGVDNIEPERIIISVDASSNEDILRLTGTHKESLHLASVLNVQDVINAVSRRPKNHGPGTYGLVYVSLTADQASQAIDVGRTAAVPIVPATALTVNTKESPSSVPVAELLLANATTDREDSLFSTAVTDARGELLGLVYSSRESVAESLRTGRGVYHSRKRGLWYKGETTGDIQELLTVDFDCDQDCLRFKVHQKGRGFCHLATSTCFGNYRGLSKLQRTLQSRKKSAPPNSYTARLFNDPVLLSAKIREEAQELCDAETKAHIAAEAADVFYFALTKCISAGVTLEDVERELDAKSLKVKRRKGDAKPQYLTNGNAKAASSKPVEVAASSNGKPAPDQSQKEMIEEAASIPKAPQDPAGLDSSGRIAMRRFNASEMQPAQTREVLQRPSQRSTDKIMEIVRPIVDEVRTGGDAALLAYTHRFEKATSLQSPVIHAPFPEHLMQLSRETAAAIDTSYENIRKFHAAQKEEKPLSVETMPGVVCGRFSRAIERVGLYVPGGTAVLPSTAMMLGVPAMVAGCRKIVLASPPRADGSITPEIVYIAHKIGAESIVLAGGAQAVAALAYGTESVSKVDKIFGPGNQFVTAAKMLVSNDTNACVGIDMPAGPSEVLVIADAKANPIFVASDLLSQAEHGTDSQVVLLAIGMNEEQIRTIEDELHRQASALPRVDIVRGAIEHSVTLMVSSLEAAMVLSNQYAPEHLILQIEDPKAAIPLVVNAGSLFIGSWTPESVGDYSAGVNHSLPTYGYARQYSGVNLSSFLKHITSSELTAEGLKNLSSAVMQLAHVEELEAHRRAVLIRLKHMGIEG